jgi:hypothetical protein
MATYLQGVTSFIPQFQPFQPDLNFYANALQTKQNQYDSNYKALNNVYGQYFYADLTHGDNIKKKDELIKAIDFNLKRVSGLDLSLEQNVEQAKQVFKPFYEDNYLMKDMAWTKNTNNQRAYGAGLKNARDKEMRAQYWDTGVRAIDYMTEEFKNSSLEETMGIGNVNYTPYVNVMEKAQKIAKDAGLSVDAPIEFSPDGKWIIKRKNGEALIPKLSHLFEATLGSDPAVVDVYKTQAYVNRKDYAYSNAAQFNGDQNAAEMSYLTESYNMLKAENEARLAKLENNDKVYNSKKNDAEKAINTNKATPETRTYLERLEEARTINSTLLNKTKENTDSLSEGSGTSNTSTGFENPYGDIESLRWKVDNAMASRLMQKDLGEAANIFAFKDAKTDVTANPYAVQAQAHQYRMQEVASANKSRERAASMASDREIEKELIASGGWVRDLDPKSPTFKQVIQKDDANLLTVIQKDAGVSTDLINKNEYAAKYTSKQITDKVVPYMTTMLASIRDLQSQGKLSNADIKNIFSNTNMTIDKLNQGLKSDPYSLITKTLGTTKLKQITNNFQNIIKQNYNKGIEAFDTVGKQMANYNIELNDYYSYVSDLQNWRKESKSAVINYVKSTVDGDLKDVVDKMFDKNGNIISEEEFNKKIKFTSESKPVYTSFTRDEFGIRDNNLMITEAKTKSPYKELKKVIHGAYGSTGVKFTSLPPMLSSIGEVKDSGLTSIGEQGINVYPGDPSSVGAFHFNSFKNNINSLDFDKDVKVSFLGATEPAPNRNAEGKALLQQIFNETLRSDNTLKGFRLAASPIAENNANKGAMTIYPDATWLKKYTKAEDKKSSTGLISQDQANYILKNGITFISNSKNWNNSLFESTTTTPFVAHVNYSKKPVVVNDPNDDTGINSLTFEKDDILGGYKYAFKFKQWSPEVNDYLEKDAEGQIYSPEDLEKVRSDAYAYWQNIQQSNNVIFNANK